MNISYPDSYFQTALFLTFLIPALILTAKKDPNPHVMNHSHTNELKGMAILMVIFSHIGYFLFSDHKTLYPLSVAGGVGVNIFLFLSGFGLSRSENRLKKTVLEFYKRRLKSIFVPMWVVLITFLILDHYLLSRSYSLLTILQNILGFFPDSSIDASINSPLWYFTLILFYYLLFPLVYRKEKPVISAILVLLLGYVMVNISLPVTKDVLKLYKLHLFAFPFGILFAYVFNNKHALELKNKIKIMKFGAHKVTLLRFLLIFLLTIIFAYTSINSDVGEKIISEALMSMITMASLVSIILLMKIQSNLLIILGKYSYEIYLIQWPLMYRYDLFYKYTPPFLGTLLYIAVFLLIGFIMKIVIRKAIKPIS